MVTFHPQGHVDEGTPQGCTMLTKKRRSYSIVRRLKKLNKGKFFFSWKKDNDVKVKCIWSTEKTQGAAVENKTFVVRWRSINF
jgi:hypothetical protein